jgi:hypothetical protein
MIRLRARQHRYRGSNPDSKRKTFLCRVQTGCGAHPVSYSMKSGKEVGGNFRSDKATGVRSLITRLLLVPRPEMHGAILSFPMYLQGLYHV